jgi:hypothetical protein
MAEFMKTFNSPAEADAQLPTVKCPALLIMGTLDPDFADPQAEGDAVVAAMPAGRARSQWSTAQFKAASGTRLWAQARFQPDDFDAALRELAAELRTPRQPLIDYLRRRQALQEWALDTSTWEALVSELPPAPGPIRPVVDDRKRQDASIFVWTQVTCGEHLFAPRPVEACQPSHLQREWAQRRSTTWFQLTRPTHSGTTPTCEERSPTTPGN